MRQKPFGSNSSHYEKKIKKLEERNQSVLDTIEEGYIEVDLQGTTVICNDSFSKIVGFSTRELIGLNYREYMDGSTAETAFAAYNKVFKTGIPNKAFCYEVITKEGDRRVIENSISLILDSEGNRTGFRSVVRDITDRIKAEKELEMHRSHLKAVFEGVKDAIITFDSHRAAIVEVNKTAEIICGFDIEKNIGRNFTDCLTQCDKKCHGEIQNFLESKTMSMECQIDCNHKFRNLQKVSIQGSRLLSSTNQVIGSVFVIRDITRIANLEQELRTQHQLGGIIGKSDRMQDTYVFINRLAELDTTVLITGASGTGKSLVAKTLHYSGSRAQKPMVTVNCSALPENLLESELFGHIKGSFTGAIKDVVGRFQTAAGGTILLDEIGDISPRIQLKLLRVLEEREFERVGESTPTRVDARVIACTNKDLKEKVRLGEFREDLYYRLKVVEVKVPSLRERSEDIPLLADHFLVVFNASMSKNIKGFSDEAMDLFMTYPWPGNVRELRHCIEHAFVLCHEPVIAVRHLPAEIRGFHEHKNQAGKKISEDEREEIRLILNKTGWNKSKAARLLGVNRSTMYRKIEKHNLDDPKA